MKESYAMACEVLLQVGEVIPNASGDTEPKITLKKTAAMLSCASEEYFLGKMCVDVENTEVVESTDKCAARPISGQATRPKRSHVETILELYNIISILSSVCKPELTPAFVWRMIQLSMKHGALKYTILGKQF